MTFCTDSAHWLLDDGLILYETTLMYHTFFGVFLLPNKIDFGIKKPTLWKSKVYESKIFSANRGVPFCIKKIA
ncbi:MAG: hypothetical protein C0407_06500 [Desulfobacca sp.]|nr:hypothetical protein [Desulfobacca sp.]